MDEERKIHLCYPCGHFSPSDLEAPVHREADPDAAPRWPESAPHFWELLCGESTERVRERAGCVPDAAGRIVIRCLNETWVVDPRNEDVRKVEGAPDGEWDREIPFLVLVYLATARLNGQPGDMVPPRDLFAGSQLFRSALVLDTGVVERRFGRDGAAYLEAAQRLGGTRIEGGDAAARFPLLPAFSVDHYLWTGDDELPASLNVLVPANAADLLPADGIAVALNLLGRRLCRIAGTPTSGIVPT